MGMPGIASSWWSGENDREDASHDIELEFSEEISVSFVVLKTVGEVGRTILYADGEWIGTFGNTEVFEEYVTFVFLHRGSEKKQKRFGARLRLRN